MFPKFDCLGYDPIHSGGSMESSSRRPGIRRPRPDAPPVLASQMSFKIVDVAIKGRSGGPPRPMCEAHTLLGFLARTIRYGGVLPLLMPSIDEALPRLQGNVRPAGIPRFPVFKCEGAAIFPRHVSIRRVSHIDSERLLLPDWQLARRPARAIAGISPRFPKAA